MRSEEKVTQHIQLYEYEVDEPFRSQMYGCLRERPKDGWMLVAVIPSENAAKVLLFWERML